MPVRTLHFAACIASAFAWMNSASAANAPLPHGCDAAGASAVAASVASPASSVFPPVQLQIRTPHEPTVLPSAGRNYLLYEVHLQNFSSDAMTVRSIQVVDADKANAAPIAEIADAQLDARLRRITIGDHASGNRALATGQSSVVFLCLAFDARTAVPNRLRHRVVLEGAVADGPVVGTRATPLRVMGGPVAGANWSPDNNPSLHSHHRMGLWVVDGTAQIARRYAIDWKKYGKDGKTWSGDQRDVRAYYAYGEKTVAVADGTVVVAQDGYPDNIPRTPAGFETAVPVTMESVAGNRVVIDLGGGQFAYYAHLKPGSVRVQTGERVKRGQVVGAIGNSGDSRQPHLHFQVTTNPDVMASEGLPYVFDRYRMKAGDGAWETRSREYPMGNVVLGFD